MSNDSENPGYDITGAFIWFEGDQIHFDAPLYAHLRRITVDEAIKELREMASKLLPSTPITEI